MFDPSVEHRLSLQEVEGMLFLDRDGHLTVRTSFWPLLVLAAIIASCGVVADSTATVVGAMIIAPLGTPIFGTALAVVVGQRRQMLAALGFLATGILIAIAIGAFIGWATPARMPVDVNPQILGRTAPTALDLVIALATGVAGAYGLTRREVAAVLPGVAIAISLVPPLGVVGITLGAGQFTLALGALLLFATNVLAILVSGVVVFTLSGYRRAAQQRDPLLVREAALALAVTLIALLIPLGLTSLSEKQYAEWINGTSNVVHTWASGSHWTVQSVARSGDTIVINLIGEGPAGSLAALQAQVRKVVPQQIPVRLVEVQGANRFL
jgi:uncharacterized hydrophobic protein (TIGR00271 family)